MLDVAPDFPDDYAVQAALHPAAWSVEDGAIVGRQQPLGSGYGGYLISDEKFGDFELTLEMKPDWPADTGVMLRRRPARAGFQALVDHRQSGIDRRLLRQRPGGFHAVPFALTAQLDANGNPVGLREDDPQTSAEPFTRAKAELLEYAAPVDEFLPPGAGRLDPSASAASATVPRVTTWINDVKIAEIDLPPSRHRTTTPTKSPPSSARRATSPSKSTQLSPLGTDRWGPDRRLPLAKPPPQTPLSLSDRSTA